MFLIHAFLKTILMLWFRPRVQGLHKIDLSQPSIIIPNHVSLLDAVLLSFCLPKGATFVVNTDIAKKYSGVGYLALRTGAAVYPVAINGLERSVFSYLKGKLRILLFPAITITVGTPFAIERDEALSMREQKASASDLILRTLQNELFQSRMQPNVNLFDKVLEAARLNGSAMEIAKDMGTAINYRTLLIGSYLLGEKLKAELFGKPVVGVFLPNSVGHLVTLLSLFRIGKTPAILNFSLGVRSLLECCETAHLDTVLTSRVFIEIGKLEHVIAGLEAQVRIVYLEDLKASSTAFDKLAALARFAARQTAQSVENELILATTSIGIIVGAFLAPRLIPLQQFTRSLAYGLGMFLVVALFPWIHVMPIAICFLLLIGFMGGVFIIPMNTILQEKGKQLVGSGKTIALQNFVENALMTVGSGIYYLIVFAGAPVSGAIVGQGVLLLAFLLYLANLRKRIRG